VVTTSPEVTRVVTDARGCYTVRGLRPDSYSVDAKLMGFKTVRRENVEVAEGATKRIDFSMCPSGLREIVWVVPRSYGELVRAADVLAHLQITASRIEPRCGEGWILSARILNVVKGINGMGHTEVEFLQQRSSTEPSPYHPLGSELVVALSGNATHAVRTAGPFGVFVVEKNVVRQPMASSIGSKYDGMELSVFLKELRGLTR